MNTLEISPELASSLGECNVGDTKTIMVTGTVTAMDATGIKLNVADVEYADDACEDEDVMEENSAMPPMPKSPPKGVMKMMGQ